MIVHRKQKPPPSIMEQIDDAVINSIKDGEEIDLIELTLFEWERLLEEVSKLDIKMYSIAKKAQRIKYNGIHVQFKHGFFETPWSKIDASIQTL